MSLLKLTAQGPLGEAEQAARGSPDRLGEDRHRSVRGKAVLLVEAHGPGDAMPGETPGRVIAGYLIRRADLRRTDPGCDQVAAAGPAITGCPGVVMLTTFDLDDYAVDASRAGASGFLLKTAPRKPPGRPSPPPRSARSPPANPTCYGYSPGS